ncbi:MAG: FmdB family transcriptional regulator [Actinobacteria bacterium]|nr:FmdB family transcriptional regulator [Actinomycetota bacterium]MSV95145.1 FmdB family transcriptional regulator [Actinomycetota bacterium]MSW61482.1 FmdB family transcriptional regulator [Actinomycetota bacterium]MSY44352.1 FmdB family transcriptional regulator [Actinomycetota bacterium]
MPTYRYRCPACNEDFEVWQSITDDALTTHVGGCEGPVVKVLTPAGIVLKGSGFYKTDNRSSSKSMSSSESKNSDGDSSDSKSGGEKSDSTKSDSTDKKTGGDKSSPTKSSTKKDSSS